MIWQEKLRTYRGFGLGLKDQSYLFWVTKFGHLEHIYYGPSSQESHFGGGIYGT